MTLQDLVSTNLGIIKMPNCNKRYHHIMRERFVLNLHIIELNGTY